MYSGANSTGLPIDENGFSPPEALGTSSLLKLADLFIPSNPLWKLNKVNLS